MVLFKGFIILLTSVTLFSCQSLLGGQRGKVVPQSNRILLQPGGPHSGIWDSPHVVFQFAYRLEKHDISISGDVLLKKDVIQGFEKVYLMVLTAYFLDNIGNIMTNEVVLNWNRPEKIDKWSVSRTFGLPQNVSAMAFGYTGDLRDGMKESAILDLYYVPTDVSSHALQ